jgi:hypothetical protein
MKEKNGLKRKEQKATFAKRICSGPKF